MARMTRVSPPLLARGLPAPQASTSVTRAPRRRSISAVQPPNAPAPITATCGPDAWDFVAARDAPDAGLAAPRPEAPRAARAPPAATAAERRKSRRVHLPAGSRRRESIPPPGPILPQDARRGGGELPLE